MSSSPSASTKIGVGKFRWVICALLFFACVVNYMDRQILALLKPKLQATFAWEEDDFANIVVAFQAAYAAGQAVAGPFIEWLGTKTAYAVAMVVWSLAAMAHVLPTSVLGFKSARFALGMGEAVNFPAAIKTVTEWFPQRERSVATGFFNTGSNIGAIVAPLLVPLLVDFCGWKGAFIILGVSGFVWLGFWYLFYEVPQKSRHLTSDELDHIESGQQTQMLSLSWRKVIVFHEAWAYWATGILVGPVWWFYLFWLPDIFSKQFNLNLKSFGLPLAAVYTVAALGSVGGGTLSAWFLRRGWSVNAARKTAALICACGTVPVIFIPRIEAVWLATFFFALATAAHQGWSATMYTVVSDIFPKNAVGSVVGYGGSIAGFASMAFSWYVGHVLKGTGVYDRILLICGSAYVAAWLIFHLAVPQIKPVRME